MQPLRIRRRRRARTVIVGLFGGKFELNMVTMTARAYRLIGSYTGTQKGLIEPLLVSLAKRGIIRAFFLNRLKLSQATEALPMLKDRKIVGRGA
jgi:alcohol dehydrogenase, propanol-preferring